MSRLQALDILGIKSARAYWRMIPVGREAIEPLARKYVWWKTADEAVLQPERVIAQVMNIGDFDDVQALAASVGEAVLVDVLGHAEAGEFSPRSWAYWHYRLGLSEYGKVPPLPSRKLG